MRIPHVLAAVVIAASVSVAQEGATPTEPPQPKAPAPATPTPAPAPATAPAPAPAPAKPAEVAPEPEVVKPIDTVPAQDAAVAWLEIVDRGALGASWDAGSTLFRAAVAREQWEKALAAARGSLGPLVARKVRSVRYLTTIPKAPEGEYVVMELDGVFGERRTIETLTVMRESDGSWKVAGYFIR